MRASREWCRRLRTKRYPARVNSSLRSRQCFGYGFGYGFGYALRIDRNELEALAPQPEVCNGEPVVGPGGGVPAVVFTRMMATRTEGSPILELGLEFIDLVQKE